MAREITTTEPIEVMKYVQLPAVQSYNGIMTAINAQRGYPSHKLGTDRYATDDIEQFAATDGKYYVPIWYDLQDLPIFDDLLLVEKDYFTYLIHPNWKINETIVIGDIRFLSEYYEAKTNHTARNTNKPPNATNWKLWEQ